MKTLLRLGSLFAVLVCLSPVATADEIDWSAWKALPVYHNGRIMPLDTYARLTVELICGRQKPTLSLKDSIPEDALDEPEYAGARSLFDGADEKKFDPAELLFSWLVEPEKWEQVPFLTAADVELREELLEIPATNEAGAHLKFASPSDVDNADAFHDRIAELRQKQRAARNSKEPFELEGLDEDVDRLYQAYQLFQQVTLVPALDGAASQALGREYQAFADSWNQLKPIIGIFGAQSRLNDLSQDDASEQFKNVTQAVGWIQELGADVDASKFETLEQQLGDFEETGSSQRPSLPAIEANITAMEATLTAARDQWRANRQLLADAPEGDAPAAEVRLMSRRMVDGVYQNIAQLVAQVQRLHAALYENGETLRVAPALDAQALEEDRDTTDDSQPWLDLQTLILGPRMVLADYPQSELDVVRQRFGQLRELYAERETRPRDFSTAMAAFADSLREFAEATEPIRRDLPIKSRDDALLAYTAYPAAGATDVEVRYNRLDPFMWAWVINLLAAVALALAFGVARKPMFWVGMAILIFGLVWNMYGFGLRIAITKWAPVTNMYETVIYVPFVVAALGTWFTLLPATWPGLRNGWRLSGIPGTWEQPPLTDEQQATMSPSAWKIGSFVLLVPRIALMWLTFSMLAVWPYAAGGRTIINRWPNVDVGASLPDFNDTVTWLVGLCVLIPTVWYLPRAVLTALVSPIMIPLSARRSHEPLLPKVYERRAIAGSAAFVAFLGTCVAWYSPLLDGNFSPLMPVLRDNFWLTIHVLTIVSSYGAGALAWGLGLVALGYYLFGKYRDPIQPRKVAEGYAPAHAVPVAAHAAKRPPEECASLAKYIYSTMQVAVLLLAAGTILGGLWADVSWGRFWGWDPKEVWALISLLTYLAILHARFAGWVGNFGLALGTVFGATSIGMSWYGVNFVLGAGLHAYGFGSGGAEYVGGFLVLNWLFAAAAAVRYLMLCEPFATRASEVVAAQDGPADSASADDGKRGPQPAVPN